MVNRAVLVLIFLICINAIAFGQRSPVRAIERDPLMEQDAKHNLDVAWQAYAPKKAYKQVILRFEETYAAYPDFSKLDEFLYLAGMSSYYLSDNKGRQKVDLKTDKDKEKFAPEKLKVDAKTYLSTLVEKYPDSKYRRDAEKTLDLIKNSK